MLEQTATVVALEGRDLWVETESRSACGHCSASQCDTAALAKALVRRNRLCLRNSLGASIGDRVIIGIPDSVMVYASVLGYLLPLLGMVVFAVAGNAWGLSEGGQSLTALIGLAGGFYAVHRQSTDKRQRFQPRLLRLANSAVSERIIRMPVPYPGKSS